VEAPANARRLMEKLGVVWPVELPPMGQRLAAEGEQRAGSAWEVSRKP
jgi:hypothetical protein